jgi:bifunctional non-homologous end joining protein LigD
MLGVSTPSVVPGARPAPSPGFIEPCHPMLREQAPSGGRWIHEIKFDGYRAQAHLRNGQPADYGTTAISAWSPRTRAGFRLRPW